MNSSPNRLLATALGAAYVLVGVLGLTVTSGLGFFATGDGLLLGILEVNMFHNLAHLLIGAALLLAGLSSTNAAKTVNAVVGAACLVLGLVGLFLIGSTLNIVALNVADNLLHFASAVVLLAAGLGADAPARS